MTTDTPRTDAQVAAITQSWADWPNFARALERENTCLTARIKELEAEVEFCKKHHFTSRNSIKKT
jgi:hypothetical protein